jgi:hypothetical protein
MSDTSHSDAYQATSTFVDAAERVIDNLGTTGASTRVQDLRAALDDLTAHDPVSAVVASAARWLDRYGSAGAPERLHDLQDAVDALRGPVLEHDDGPPCDTDPVAHEERLAFLEPDEGQN